MPANRTGLAAQVRWVQEMPGGSSATICWRFDYWLCCSRNVSQFSSELFRKFLVSGGPGLGEFGTQREIFMLLLEPGYEPMEAGMLGLFDCKLAVLACEVKVFDELSARSFDGFM